jgi:hypothetical protein
MKGARIASRLTIHESRRGAGRRPERGLTFFGALFLLAVLAAGGYFGYQWYLGHAPEAPTCKDDFTACMRMCRRLTTETAEAQKCQARCEGESAACERRIGGS